MNITLVWEDNDALLLLSIHHNLERFGKAHMADILCLLHCRHRIEHILLEYTVVLISIDGEISYAE